MANNLVDKLKQQTVTTDDQLVVATDEEEAVVKQPAGFYSDHCNCIYVGNGLKYPWPTNAPFDMKQVAKKHQKRVLLDINSMISRGYAYEVKDSEE